jgi:membrane protease subunit HflK
VIVDTKGSGNLLYLPLDKLMQSTGSAPAAVNPETSGERSSTPASAQENRDVRSRGNNLSSRERGER